MNFTKTYHNTFSVHQMLLSLFSYQAFYFYFYPDNHSYLTSINDYVQDANIRHYNWNDARELCRNQGSTLPVVRNRRDQLEIVSLVKLSPVFRPSEALFIGLTIDVRFFKSLCSLMCNASQFKIFLRCSFMQKQLVRALNLCLYTLALFSEQKTSEFSVCNSSLCLSECRGRGG